MQHPDESTIHTWLDGELAPDESAALEAHIASCPECSAAVAEARGLIAASSRILTKLDDVSAGVIPGRQVEASISRSAAAASVSGRPARHRTWWTRSGLAAAAVVFVAAGTWVVARRVAPGATEILGSAPESAARATDSIAADRAPVAPENTATSASRDSASFAKAAVPSANRTAPPAATSQSGTAGQVAAAAESRPRQATSDSARPLARRNDRDQNLPAAERLVPARPAAPAPAPAIASPLAESVATQRAPAKREPRELKATENVVTTGASADLSAKDARSQKSAAPSALAELQQAMLLAGCYDVRIDPAGREAAALQSTTRPSRIALDTTVAPVESDPAHRVARDITPSDTRTGTSMSWRPTGPQSFELVIGTGASANRYSIIVGTSAEPSRTDEARVAAPAPGGAAVSMRATRVACPRQ